MRSLRSSGPRLYVGGEFTAAGGLAAARVAYWDGAWHEMRGGTDSNVYGMAWVHDELHAGGAFTNAQGGGVYSPRWAKFMETGAPWIASHPSSRTAEPGQTVTFTATPAAGYPALGLQWYRFGTPLLNGPTGTGSTISGSGGTTLTIANISHTDYGEYWLRASNPCGADSSLHARLDLTGTVDAAGPVTPEATAFLALGPNPARGPAAIAFALARAANVRFTVHDIAGRRVREVEVGRLEPGRHEARWDAQDDAGARVRNGLYFVALEVDGRRLAARRLTILR